MKIFDVHNDFLTSIKNNKKRKQYLELINNNKNIDKICCVIWTSKIKKPLKYIKKIYDLFFKKNKNKKIFLCIEDLGFINKKNLEESLLLLKGVKPFYCGLVWNYDNNLGGGAYGKKGLTKLGIKVIKFLEENKILIDTAHMNRKTFSNFSKITSMPIINSHSNFNFLKRHKRNLINSQIKSIINSKGQICLSFVPEFIGEYFIESSIIARQIANFTARFGYKSLSVGTDFYGTNNLPLDLKNYSHFKNLQNELLNLGFNKKTIDCIFYKNMKNFYKKIKR